MRPINLNFQRLPDSRRAQEILLGLVATLLVVIKLVLVADLSLTISYAPHDDSLYIERALALLSGEGFGPYDSRILIKYPGISFWLAGTRLLGLPFLLSVNLVYVVAGCYMLSAFLRCGISRGIAVAAFGFFLFNPITFGVEWTRVIREPLSMGLFVILVASMIWIAALLAEGKRAWNHLLIFSVAFAFSLYLREDDRLLWGLLVLFFATLGWLGRQRIGGWCDRRLLPVVGVLIIPLATALSYGFVLHVFVERHYGLQILHEYSEGEYPLFLAAIRSIDSAKDNRMVMVTQEALQRLHEEVPRLAPVINLLPAPGPGTHSCKLHGVCSEWSNGWMPFWIRDAAFRAGVTPSLPAAQAYFRDARLDIERACQSGRLNCTPRGSALVPPMELRWIRAYVAEAWRLAKMALWPETSVIATPLSMFDVPVELGRKFQAITMTDRFDTQLQTNFEQQTTVTGFKSPFANMRHRIVAPYRLGAMILLLVGTLVLVWRLVRLKSMPPSPLAAVAIVVAIYLFARLAILSYVAVFMGAFDFRMMFSTYTAGVFLALPFIYESLTGKQKNA